MKLENIRALPNIEFDGIETKRLLNNGVSLEPLVKLIEKINGNRLLIIQKALRQLNQFVDPKMLLDVGKRYGKGQSFSPPSMDIRLLTDNGEEVVFKLEYVKYIVSSGRECIFEVRNSLKESDNSSLSDLHRKEYGYADRIFFFVEKNLLSNSHELLYYMVDTLDKISENDKTNELVINTGNVKSDFIINKSKWIKQPYVNWYLQEFDERGSV